MCEFRMKICFNNKVGGNLSEFKLWTLNRSLLEPFCVECFIKSSQKMEQKVSIQVIVLAQFSTTDIEILQFENIFIWKTFSAYNHIKRKNTRLTTNLFVFAKVYILSLSLVNGLSPSGEERLLKAYFVLIRATPSPHFSITTF